MPKALLIVIAIATFIGGGVLLWMEKRLPGGACIAMGCLAIGCMLPPTDHDTTGGSGASDAN